ncbi:ArdC-like ssDNA-binding domain-containing protein [Draconibacterium orientale]|uniref:ArdC-like ssDNA-binding domain-containing protein n=1 Tax=Draconibacterium orientale TaxID=1168034 RepID=UPI0038B35D00
MSKFDIYETVTNLIVERLEAGVIPWHMPWKTASAIPRNLVSKQPYRDSISGTCLALVSNVLISLLSNRFRILAARSKRDLHHL